LEIKNDKRGEFLSFHVSKYTIKTFSVLFHMFDKESISIHLTKKRKEKKKTKNTKNKKTKNKKTKH